jgi:DNA end-binding protein Ku
MPRAIWKGHLKIAELACPVALYSAASTRDRISFHTVNRATGNPVRREYVEEETEKPVPAEDQVKGYEVEKDRYIILTPEDLAKAAPDSDKILHVEAFLDCPDIDTTYFDKPYYLAPASRDANPAFALIREGMRDRNTAALARATLFRRVRTVLIRAQGPGLVANTLNFDYEVRAALSVFRGIPDIAVEGEMLDLAKHIIKTKSGSFDPARFDDRYDAALAELVRAKAEGRAIPQPEKPSAPKVVSLLDALRESAGGAAKGKAGKQPAAKRRASSRGQAEPKRKAG